MVIEVSKINAVNNSSSSSSINASDSASAIPQSFASASILEDAQQALKHWESNFNKKLSPKLKKIAIEAYNIHHREDRGITRKDLVNRLGYSSKYAKRIMYECQNNKLLTHLEGYKQVDSRNTFYLQKLINL
jgi:hypothetical protein